MALNRIQQISEATKAERDDYLNAIGWEDNPFSHRATMDEYVLPSGGTIADIASHIQNSVLHKAA